MPSCCGQYMDMTYGGGCGGWGSVYKCLKCGRRVQQKTGGIISTPGGEQYEELD